MESKEKMKVLKKFLKTNDVEEIDINDSFGFKCQQCGKCCINRDDIILNPFDVYNAAKYLGISVMEFIDKYTYITLGRQSKIPMLLLQPLNNGFCPLLKFDIKDGGKFKCMIHSAKPGACANHPIGVSYCFNKNIGESEVNYIKVKQCSNSVSDEMHTVKEWIQPYLDHQKEIDIAHKIQHLSTDYFNPRKFWTVVQILNGIVDFKKDLISTEKDIELPNDFLSITDSLLNKYTTLSIEKGYAQYDINKPFIEQAEDNIKDLNDFYAETKNLYDFLVETFKIITKKDFEEEFEQKLLKEEQEEE